jgi:hypothetical protein
LLLLKLPFSEKLMGQAQVWLPEDGPLTLEGIRARHVPPEWHRISEYRYPAGTRFSGRMRAATCYVLSGQCVYRFQDDIFLQAGMWSVFEPGEYEMEVVGDEELTLVLVWKLPFPVD